MGTTTISARSSWVSIATTFLVVITFLAALSPLASRPALAAGHGSYGAKARWFWVQHGDSWRHVKFGPLASSQRADVFAPLHSRVSRQQARSLATTFDTRTFPTDTHLFGLPWHLGRITILLAPLSGVTLGYFDQNDLMPVSASSFDALHANRGNILYVREPDLMPDPNGVTEVNEAIAHEFQHLINYRIRVLDHHYLAEDEWLNEGLSFYAQMANGYWTQRDELKVQAAAQEPSWPVTYLSETTAFLRSHARVAYGRAGLFVSYLASRFGDDFGRALVSDRYTGLQAVGDVLRTLSPGTSLSQVFADWGVAGYLNKKGIYGYSGLPTILHEPPVWLVAPVASYPWDSQVAVPGGLALKPWSHSYLHFTIKRNVDLRVRVSGPPGRYRVAAILQDSGGVNHTQVRWPTCHTDGHAVFRIREFGGFYDELSLVLTNTGSMVSSVRTTSDPIRVTAELVPGHGEY